MNEESLPPLLACFRLQPYVGLGVLMLVFGAGWMVLFPSRKRAALWAAASAAPFGTLGEKLLVPDYWTPVQWRLLGIGLGDVLFAFASGGVSWLLATHFCGRHLTLSWDARRIARRFLICSTIGLCLACALCLAGIRIHIASLMAMWAGLLCLRSRYRRFGCISLTGALVFGVCYPLLLRASYWLAPAFALQWNHEGLSGVAWFGVPAEEVLWAVTFGAVWPPFMAYVLDAQSWAASREAS